MKLEIGVPSYDFKNGVKSAQIRGQRSGKNIPLVLIPMEAMDARHARLPWVRGIPAYVAHDAKKMRLWLHPLPDSPYTLDVEELPIAAPKEPDRFASTITRAVLGKK